MDLTVIGTGIPGLVAGASFAEAGHDVTFLARSPERTRRICSGEALAPEPGLGELVMQNLARERLRFTFDARAAIRSAEVVFIAVDDDEERPGIGGRADLDRVLGAAALVGCHTADEKVVVTMTPVPVGASRQIRAAVETRTAHPVHVCAAPTHLRSGRAVQDFRFPDRLVLGVESQRSREVLGEIYAPFLRNGAPISFMDLPSAEFAAYADSGRLSSRISFMNLISRTGGRSRGPVGPVAREAAEAGSPSGVEKRS